MAESFRGTFLWNSTSRASQPHHSDQRPASLPPYRGVSGEVLSQQPASPRTRGRYSDPPPAKVTTRKSDQARLDTNPRWAAPQLLPSGSVALLPKQGSHHKSTGELQMEPVFPRLPGRPGQGKYAILCPDWRIGVTDGIFRRDTRLGIRTRS